jgi:cysteine sulfinate desulfinase/cysteine desulfurase-like protein
MVPKVRVVSSLFLSRRRPPFSLFCLLEGIGALFIRRRPRVRVEAIQTGGGQERGIRSGTVPTFLTVGLGAACELSAQEMEASALERSNLSLSHKNNKKN